jgi:hypothetical protein
MEAMEGSMGSMRSMVRALDLKEVRRRTGSDPADAKRGQTPSGCVGSPALIQLEMPPVRLMT